MPPNNNSRNNNTTPNTQPVPLNEDIIRDIVSIQKSEVAIRQQEAAFRDQEIKLAHELSLKTLEAQKDYIMNAPKRSFKHMCLILGFIAFTIAVIAGIVIFCLCTQNKDIASRLIIHSSIT
ncbi:hypothetical protein SAMN05661012_00558 [Chitinophaga sancti]|uniref:Uncharacterized protein n=1 Tax=Chitinophaga sancti TaxID=1004 RepID=A0A1K1MGL7_9BACT|nr:hypothetical protein SAMN05661012_00558 [Chitinophaga sancti]